MYLGFHWILLENVFLIKMKNAPPERISSYCDPRNWQCPFRSIGILNYFSKLVFELESFVSLLELKQIHVLGLLHKLLTLRPKYFCSHNLFLIVSRHTTNHHVMTGEILHHYYQLASYCEAPALAKGPLLLWRDLSSENLCRYN